MPFYFSTPLFPSCCTKWTRSAIIIIFFLSTSRDTCALVNLLAAGCWGRLFKATHCRMVMLRSRTCARERCAQGRKKVRELHPCRNPHPSAASPAAAAVADVAPHPKDSKQHKQQLSLFVLSPRFGIQFVAVAEDGRTFGPCRSGSGQMWNTVSLWIGVNLKLT